MELPWQVIAVAIVSNAVVIVALVMQLRDRADRQIQRDNETVRSIKTAIHSGIKEGHEIYLEMRAREKEFENEISGSGRSDFGRNRGK